jgi:uncharacterized DUF497 family protein
MNEFIRLVWDEWNVAHIARHEVLPNEAQEVCDVNPVFSEAYKGRIRVIGPTNTGRMLTVILEPEGENSYYVVTARPATAENVEDIKNYEEIDVTSNNRKLKRGIPEFSSREEEAEFWDTHDTTDFEGEFKPVDVRFAKKLTHVMKVPLDAKAINDLRLLADERGLGLADMLQMWIMQRLNQEKALDTGS